MSLYDSFFSDINKDHVYHLIKDIVFENHQINIFLDDEYKQLYDKNLQRIFDDNNVNNLEEINKITVNDTIYLFNDKIKLQSSDDTTYDTNVNSAYDNLFSERMKQNEVFKNIKGKEEDKEKAEKAEKAENDRKILEHKKFVEEINEQEKVNQEKVNQQNVTYQIVQQQQLKTIIEEQNSEQPLPVVEEFRQVHKIVSNKRTHVKSSRYNYSFNLKNNNIIIESNSSIQKLIIPFEDNYIFNHSVICLTIKELDIDISLELEKELVNNHRTYGVYVPIEAHRFNQPSSESITINITDITNTEYVNYDIINVTKLEIKEDSIILNVNSTKDTMMNDYLKVLNLSTNIMELRYLLLEPMKVIMIEKNRLFFKTNYIMNNTVIDDIEMKLMNVSNQNIIFFR